MKTSVTLYCFIWWFLRAPSWHLTEFVIVVGDSPMTRIMDLPKGYINQELTALLQLLDRTLAGRACCGTDLAECVSAAGDFLWPQGAIPPGFYLRLDPPKKGLVPHLHVQWGVQQIPSSSSCSKHLACLCVRWTKEPLLRDLDTFVLHLISPCWVIYLLTPNNRS